MVTHPEYSGTIFNMSSLKYTNFNVEDDDNKLHFRFSICSTLKIPCNNNLDAAACLSINGNELIIGLFSDEIVFDNSKIYLSMQGETCIDNGPNSVTTIRFVCDYSDSKYIYHKTVSIIILYLFVGLGEYRIELWLYFISILIVV